MKLTHKLTLAFLLLSLIVIGLAVTLIWGLINYQFNQYLEVQRQNDFAVAAKNYYLTNRTWDGIDNYLREQQLLPPLNEVNPPPQPFVLVDTDRKVIIASAPYVVGEKVKQGTLDKGIPIESGSEVFGTVISTGQPLVRNPIDQKYVDQINRGFWLAGIVGMLFALGFGLLLARSLTRPVRDLTTATRNMAQGQLEQQVPVRSGDELGELAQAFNQMSADLALANRSRKQMTADIAHDLRNPLTVLSGYLESLQDGKLKPTPERFAIMQAEVTHLQHLVEDLRTLSLADAGELKLHLEPTSIPELLERVAEAYRHQAQLQQINLKVEIEPNLPEINLDPSRMEQVLGNLVSNALRYTAADGEIRLEAKQLNGSLSVSVIDNGSGIPAEILPHIFERSYRGDESRSGNESGLGLAIAKSIIELHGGHIRAESDKAGTRFFIIL
ncbi:MAG: HAMP domain-containing protein [Anaerolineales bacterium]|nr:HAMP domain-containing protein [Anaerolineales bacterium]MBP6210747.1 HAMP domain-containing protein [Anaerolineales bacterium]